MFDGGDDTAIFADHGGKAGINYPVEMRCDQWFTRQVNPAKADTMIFGCGKYPDMGIFPGMNA